MTLRLPDSGAASTPDGRREAPSATRNTPAILQALADRLPRLGCTGGRALELASGSGQHAAALAAALPGFCWQPTDLDPANMASIAAWAAQARLPNLAAPQVLDACAPGWGAAWQAGGGADLVVTVNLTHLISREALHSLVAEVGTALNPGGVWALYGPFLRDGQATSPGDAAFDASLRAQDPRLGYKDAGAVAALMAAAGMPATGIEEMPANNLMLFARRPAAATPPARR